MQNSGSYFIQNDVIYVQGRINGKRYKRSTKKRANSINLKWISRQNCYEVLLKLIDEDNELKRNRQYNLESFGLEVLKLGKDQRIDSVQRDLESAFYRHVLPYFKNYEISDIKAHDIEVWQKKLSKTLSTRSVKRCRFILGKILDKAYANDLTSKNYNGLAEKVKLTHKKQEPYSLEEMKLILNNSNGWFKIYLYLSFLTGMRVGELLALKWTDIDFESQLIHLQRSISKGVITEGSKLESEKVIKNHYRSIILPDILISKLIEYKEVSKNNIWLFPSRTGYPYFESKSVIKTYFKPLLTKLNIPYKTLKATRHTYISLLRNEGIDKSLIQDLVGHVQDSSVTDTHYTTLEITQYKIDSVNQVFKNMELS